MWGEKMQCFSFCNDNMAWSMSLQGCISKTFCSLAHISPENYFWVKKKPQKNTKRLLIVASLMPLQSRSIACLHSSGGLGPLPSQSLMKPASSLDQGIKVWVICIDFMCRYAVLVMLISVVHKFPLKMSSLLHFLCHPSILWLEGLVINPKGGCLVQCIPGDCRFSKFSWISAMVEGVGGASNKVLYQKQNQKQTQKTFKDFSLIFRRIVSPCPEKLANG